MKLVFATRPSALARWQTQWVMRALQQAWPGIELEEKVITTSGDRILDKPLPEIGGKGLFTQELEAELLAGRVHAAVHSLKDLPVEDGTGLETQLIVGAVPARAEVRDALVSGHSYTLDTLPPGANVGTSSLRRSAQLLAYRPDLHALPLRGNVDTRVRKALDGQYDAIVLAGAGLERLELSQHVSQWLPLDVMLPAPGQGALAVQCRREDAETLRYLAALDDRSTHRAVTAERAFLAALGGGCAVPVAAIARVDGSKIQLNGLVASLDGGTVLRVQVEGEDPQALGQTAARNALRQGASEILMKVSDEKSR